MKQDFTNIYRSNYWNSKESVSGGGSELSSTEHLRSQLPDFFKKFDIRSILDIPCGDFNWMKEVDYGFERYIGADIVDEIVMCCNSLYWEKNRHFVVLDITKDELPEVDLIFIKDLFLHFSIQDINSALDNIRESKSKYVIISNGTDGVKENRDIKTGGGYRGVNLIMPPFSLPIPIFEIDTHIHQSKMSLWRIEDL